MTIGVVETFEAVNVQQHQGKRCVVTAGPCALGLQPGLESTPIGNPGQPINRRQRVQFAHPRRQFGTGLLQLLLMALPTP